MRDLKSFLNDNYTFYYNVLGGNFLYSHGKKNTEDSVDLESLRALDDRATNTILVRYEEETREDISLAKFDRLIDSDFTQEINPFEIYIKKLPKPNEKSEFEKLLKSIKTKEKDYFSWAFKKWFVAYIACALEKNVSNHAMLILVGKQGIGKSTWCKNLLPPLLKSYFYSGIFNPSDKDHLAYLSDKLIINVDELSGYNKKSLDSFKEVISKADFSIRRPYGRRNNDYVRRASFIGSSNNNDILIDMTGNRRFLCVEIESIDYNLEIDYDLLYSEMYQLYKSDFKYWFDEADIKRIEKHNLKFSKRSNEEDVLLNHVLNPKTLSKDELAKSRLVWLTVTEIITKTQQYFPRNYRVIDSMIGKILTKEDFDFKTSNGTRKYHVALYTDAEIVAVPRKIKNKQVEEVEDKKSK